MVIGEGGKNIRWLTTRTGLSKQQIQVTDSAAILSGPPVFVSVAKGLLLTQFASFARTGASIRVPW